MPQDDLTVNQLSITARGSLPGHLTWQCLGHSFQSCYTQLNVRNNLLSQSWPWSVNCPPFAPDTAIHQIKGNWLSIRFRPDYGWTGKNFRKERKHFVEYFLKKNAPFH